MKTNEVPKTMLTGDRDITTCDICGGSFPEDSLVVGDDFNWICPDCLPKKIKDSDVSVY